MAQETGMKSEGAKAPISTHPAFPFIVALWFAALLGIGSLVVPVPLIEQITVSTGLSSIIPATAPPLGFTARALMALGFTVLGAISGLLIARQVARAHSSTAPQRFRAVNGASAKRSPINAHEELGENGFDDTAPRRRALAIDVEEGPSEYFDFAPLPGRAAGRFLSAANAADMPDFDLTAEADEPSVEDDSENHSDDVMELSEMAFADSPAEDMDELGDEDGAEPMTDRPQIALESESPVPAGYDARPDAAEAEDQFDTAWFDAEEDDDADVDALAFSPPSLKRDEPADVPAPTHARFAAPLPQDEIYDEDAMIESSFQPATEPDLSEADPVEVDPGEEIAHAEWDEAELGDLALVQLAQRLGSSIEKHRQMRAARAKLVASAPIPARAMPSGFDVAEPDEAAEAMKAYFSKSEAAGEEPVTAHDEPAPFASFAQPAHGFAEPEADLEDDLEAGAGSEDDDGSEDDAVDQPPAGSEFRLFANFAHLGGIDAEDDGDEDDLAASFNLPLERMRAETAQAKAPAASKPLDFSRPADAVPLEAKAPPASFADPGEEFPEDEEQDFASLVARNNPFAQRAEEFVRIEDEPQAGDDHVEPAVVFPHEAGISSAQDDGLGKDTGFAASSGGANRPFDGPSGDSPEQVKAKVQPKARPVNPEENERALREALLNLQRMSGVA